MWDNSSWKFSAFQDILELFFPIILGPAPPKQVVQAATVVGYGRGEKNNRTRSTKADINRTDTFNKSKNYVKIYVIIINGSSIDTNEYLLEISVKVILINGCCNSLYHNDNLLLFAALEYL